MLNEGVRPAAHDRPRPSAFRVSRVAVTLAVIAAYLWVAGTVHVPTARAAATCTGWASTVTPPSTIRVLRTSGPASGSVQTVDFRTYVNTVMSAEWSPGPTDAVRVGALAVKQYAWYWTMVWRGKKAADGSCYDVVDTTNDQIYRPERNGPIKSLTDAVDATWSISLRKAGRLFQTGYRTGANLGCGADVDGWILYQASLYKCARAGETFEQLIHRYLDPVEIVRPGTGDSTGDGLGDVVVVTPGGETTNVRLYGAGRVTAPGPVVTTALGIPVALPIAPAQTIFRQLADVTGDHLDDILMLQRAGDEHYQIWVAASVGDAFAPPQLWWESAISPITFAPGGLVRFVAGDFTGDGRADAGLLVADTAASQPLPAPVPTPTSTPTASPTGTSEVSVVIGAGPSNPLDPFATPSATATVAPTAVPTPQPLPTPVLPSSRATATLWILPGTGSSLGPPTAAWTGPLALDGTTLFGGDVNSDGRADVVLQEDLAKQPGGGSGLRYAVIRTGAPSGSDPEPWLDLPDLAASGAKPVMLDLNRDGRQDLVVDRVLGANGSEFLGLFSSGQAFTPRSIWRNAGSFRWSASRLAGADIDGDGRGDIVVLYNGGAAGSRLYRFLSNGSALTSAGVTTDPTLPWAGAAPY